MQASSLPRPASSRASSARSSSSSRASSPGKKKKSKKPSSKAKTSPTSVIMDNFHPTSLPSLAEEAALASDTLRRLNNEVPVDAEPEPLEEFELLAELAPRALEPVEVSDDVTASPGASSPVSAISVASPNKLTSDSAAKVETSPSASSLSASPVCDDDKRDLLNDEDWGVVVTSRSDSSPISAAPT